MSAEKNISIFYDFGRYMRILGIAAILSIFPYISILGMVITFIVIILISADLRDINKSLKNPILDEFRGKLLSGILVRVIGMIICTISSLMIPIIIFIRNRLFGGIPWLYFTPSTGFIIGAVIAIVIGYILIIVGSSTEMSAWNIFVSFLQQNSNLVPQSVYGELIEGAEKSRTGALLLALAFLVITVFIGLIFQAVGYFKLASFYRLAEIHQSKDVLKVKIPPKPETEQQLTSESISEKIPINSAKFCPICGEEVQVDARFCGACGSSLKKN
ncbi:MAG: zinc ribbon domain-containing protein [Promethearchaeota archaeon]